MNVTRRKRLVENPGKLLHIDVGHPGAAVHRGRPAEASRHLWQKRCLLECSAHAQLLNPWQCSYWWNGGGEGSVHSSVVAPMPQGLAAASFFWAKA